MNIDFKYECLQPGDYKTAAKWQITLVKNGVTLSTEHTMGCAFRRFMAAKGWKPVPQVMFGKRPTYNQRAQLERSKPTPPELDDVLYSLYLDASSVDGYTFADWADDFGYSDDSIKAREIYFVCQNTLTTLQKMGLYDLLPEYLESRGLC